MLSEFQQKIFNILETQAKQISAPDDLTWQVDLGNLISLADDYLIKLIPGSEDPYVIAAQAWQNAWDLVIVANYQGRPLTYQAAKDYLQVREMLEEEPPTRTPYQEEVGKILTEAARTLATPGDLTWEADLEAILDLLEGFVRGADENNEYVAALKVWEKIWEAVLIAQSEGNLVTYQSASDALKLQEMEF